MTITHRVRAGEGISSIAEQYGLTPAVIWRAPENQDLVALRKDPNVLLPGDTLFIPDRRPKSVPVQTGRTHRFVRKAVPAVFRLRLVLDGRLRANEEYTLTVDGGRPRIGRTDGDGVLREYVPTGARQGTLQLGVDESFDIDFGMLDPHTELSGVQKRLNNLGFDCGEPDGTPNPRMVLALRRFQAWAGLPVTGEADAATTERLAHLHDSPQQWAGPGAAR